MKPPNFAICTEKLKCICCGSNLIKTESTINIKNTISKNKKNSKNNKSIKIIYYYCFYCNIPYLTKKKVKELEMHYNINVSIKKPKHIAGNMFYCKKDFKCPICRLPLNPQKGSLNLIDFGAEDSIILQMTSYLCNKCRRHFLLKEDYLMLKHQHNNKQTLKKQNCTNCTFYNNEICLCETKNKKVDISIGLNCQLFKKQPFVKIYRGGKVSPK